MNDNDKEKVLHDIAYDKTKLLYKFCKILHFIERHGEPDAKAAGDNEFHKLLDNIEKDLKKHAEQLKNMLCKLCK